MKNWEFYEEEIKNNPAFAVVDGKVVECIPPNCHKCSIKNIRCCDERIKFLYQEHKEPVVLTDDEKALCRLLGRGWIARDKNDTLWWYQDNPPTKQTNDRITWCNIGGLCTMIHKLFPQCKFDFIK